MFKKFILLDLLITFGRSLAKPNSAKALNKREAQTIKKSNKKQKTNKKKKTSRDQNKKTDKITQKTTSP